MVGVQFKRIRGAIASFFTWWLNALLSLVPRRLHLATGRRPGIVLALGSSEIIVAERAAECERVLGSVAGDAPDRDQRLRTLLCQSKRGTHQVTVRLARNLGLCRTVALPLAARDDLEQLLRFEMDRLTPFRADDVYFAHRIVATDVAGRRIMVELQLVPKRVIEHALETVQPLGISAAGVELAVGDAASAGPLNLLRGKLSGDAGAVRVTRAPVVLALILAAIAVAIPFWRQQGRLEDLESRVAAAQAEAEESLALREHLDQLTQSTRFLITMKTRRTTVSEILAELTRLLPDQAHITQLELRDGSLQLHGYAGTTSDLIALLEDSQLFRTPQFRSPVTQDADSGLERFHLSVELGPPEGS